MIGSLYSGVTGLKANTSAMSVIGDNIANVGTTGFKTSRVSFANVFSSTLSQSGTEIGNGVQLTGVNAQWDSGSLENTTNATDLAINGTGLFVVTDPATGGSYYTRAGNFEWDAQGNLVTTDGYIVQGYSIDTDGTVAQTTSGIALPNGTSEPKATTEITFGLNLNSEAEDGDTFSSSITTYDSRGSEVTLDIRFTRVVNYDHDADATTASLTGWTWDVVTTSLPTGASCDGGSGYLEFNSDGSLNESASFTTYTTANVVDLNGDGTPDNTVGENSGFNPIIQISGLNGDAAADDMNVTWTFLNENGDSDGSITSYGSESAKTAQSQDGYASGSLQSVSVNEDGIFTAVYSNGSMIPFSRLALADFPSYSGLAKMGSNLYAASINSGNALISAANTTGLGSISASSLEMSNVDLATEFVEMITTQRAYQANSKVITTSDEILQELINLKR
ncbi:putative Flagellar hook protein FlgE [Desulfosarcina cetonica]|nr:putative Flagellar hook protein FlgE [Desulfosarcina cetonica]